jgi:hypothetical protein
LTTFFFLLYYFAFNYTTKNLKIKNKHDMRVGLKKKLTNKGFLFYFLSSGELKMH